MEITKDLTLKFLREIYFLRELETAVGELYGLRKIKGFCHLYIGQEAVAVGTLAAIDKTTDHILTTYRDHSHAYLMGISAKQIIAELLGKTTGCSKGSGGSMHLFDKTKHMHGGNGILGQNVGLATGYAFAQKYRKEQGVTLTYFGDGAFHEGILHEALNMAKIWKLPLIFICENNTFGMGTPVKEISALKELKDLATAYDIPNIEVNGMDVFEVYKKTQEAVKTVKTEKTPYFLEIKTYRYVGHSMTDPQKYRTVDDVQKQKLQDPLHVKDLALEKGYITEKAFTALQKTIKTEVNEAIAFADQSPEPDFEELKDSVYAP